MKASKHPLATALDGNPEVRNKIIERLNKAMEKAPIALLHQIAQFLEMHTDDSK